MLFSVIVPIYNVQKYLNRCIESVLSQTFGDFELILVDDGSLDECGAICDEYAKKDVRIKVVHKPNGGLVSARQAGIQVATGEYVFHLDGDDAIFPDTLENAYQIIEKTNADIVSFSHQRYTDGVLGKICEDPVDEGLYHKEDMKKIIYPKLLSDINMRNLFYFMCGKAIRRSIAIKHQLNVNPAISVGEDISCGFPCYMDAERVYMSKKVGYVYTIRNDSLTTTFKAGQITQVADAIIGLRNLTVEKPDDFEEQIARYSCFMCFAILAAAAEGNHFKALGEIKKLLRNSIHWEEIKKARFEHISIKSRITITLMKQGYIGLAFYFLNFCKKLKDIRKDGSK